MSTPGNVINDLRAFCRNKRIQFTQELVDETGLPNEKTFHVQTVISNLLYPGCQRVFNGFGQSIKKAKHSSASSALSYLKSALGDDKPFPGYGDVLSPLRLNEEELLPSTTAYNDLLALGSLFKVPVHISRSGPDYCISFCHSLFNSAIGFQDASFKALNALHAAIKSVDSVAVQSYVWRLAVIANLRGLVVSYAVEELTQKSCFSVDCLIATISATSAKARSVVKAKELAARAMLDKLKGKNIINQETVQSCSKCNITSHKKVFDSPRGHFAYKGSLHPVERLNLHLKNKGDVPVIYAEERICSLKTITHSRDGIKVTTTKSKPEKFRFTCIVKDQEISGDICVNKRLAKRSAAEKVLQALQVDAYPDLKSEKAVSPIHNLSVTGKKGTFQGKSGESAVTFSCAKKVYLFDSAPRTNFCFKQRSLKRLRSQDWLRTKSNSSPQASDRHSLTFEINSLAHRLSQLGTVAVSDEPITESPSISNSEAQTRNFLQEAISWQLLARLGSLLVHLSSQTGILPVCDAVSLDEQLLQMCNRFSIPCQLTDLSSGGANIHRARKFHDFSEGGSAFLLQIGERHVRPLALLEKVDKAGCQTLRLQCAHEGKGGCFLATASNRESCKKSLALYTLQSLFKHPKVTE